MKILKQKLLAEDIFRMINAQLEVATMNYNYAKVIENKIIAEVMAETKWQLVELKMQFVDFLVEQNQKTIEKQAACN